MQAVGRVSEVGPFPVSSAEVSSDERRRSQDKCAEGDQSLEAGLSGEVALLDATGRVPVGGEVGRHDGASEVYPSALAADQKRRCKQVEERQRGPVEVEPPRSPFVRLKAVVKKVGDMRDGANEKQAGCNSAHHYHHPESGSVHPSDHVTDRPIRQVSRQAVR